MVTMLKRLHLPTSLTTVFDPPKSEATQAEFDNKVERAIEFLNGILVDFKTPLTLRRRNNYIRAVLGPQDYLLNYDEGMKSVARSLRKTEWEHKDTMF
jgi:hypothetical protein